MHKLQVLKFAPLESLVFQHGVKYLLLPRGLSRVSGPLESFFLTKFAYALLLLCTYALFCFCHLDGGKNGGLYTGRVGGILACDVEGGAVSG